MWESPLVDAVTVIGDAEFHVVLDARDREGDVSSRRRMAQSVVQEIPGHLRQPLAVRPQAGVPVGREVQRDVLRGEAISDRRGGCPSRIAGVDPCRCDRGVRLLGLGQRGGVGRETHQSAGLFAQHRYGGWVQRLHAVLHCLEVCLQYRHRSADLVGKITEELLSRRLHRLQPISHPVESHCKVIEFITEPG
ncbi:hypothetical protein WN67_32075 [Mycolicibacterium obuense]|uniref:Uncharacterized protein n=1 Tax=Mycolicibacterium obuense TaxID=1807 RepID=A0A0M2WDD5_9MYCO|nr:hypothetical protein WN67_32075 [Mycolicibacterium obuense]